jgi:hypothetical protein
MGSRRNTKREHKPNRERKPKEECKPKREVLPNKKIYNSKSLYGLHLKRVTINRCKLQNVTLHNSTNVSTELRNCCLFNYKIEASKLHRSSELHRYSKLYRCSILHNIKAESSSCMGFGAVIARYQTAQWRNLRFAAPRCLKANFFGPISIRRRSKTPALGIASSITANLRVVNFNRRHCMNVRNQRA